MRAAGERLAARLVTGPLAFLLAGLIDLGVFAAYALKHAWIGRRRARDTSLPSSA